MNKDSVQYKVILLAVMSAICGLLLGAVNSITAPVIAEANLATVKSSLEQIYPGADFAEVTDFTDDSGYITAVYTAEGKGTVYSIHGVGYNSDGFDFLYGINDDGTTSGFVVLSENETDGFGKRCFTDESIANYTAISVGDDIPMVSGATLTSTAIRNGITAAWSLWNASK